LPGFTTVTTFGTGFPSVTFSAFSSQSECVAQFQINPTHPQKINNTHRGHKAKDCAWCIVVASQNCSLCLEAFQHFAIPAGQKSTINPIAYNKIDTMHPGIIGKGRENLHLDE
jgi:hypothetical protein